MSYQKSLHVRVVGINQITAQIKHFIFESIDDVELPHFSGGSHIVVIMRDDQHTYKNPYSLIGDGYHNQQYQIAVRQEEASRGGSRFMHEKVKIGDTLEIMPPANLFMIDRLAHKHLLIAGGIGITPFLSMLHDLHRAHAHYELHYCARDVEHAAFWSDIVKENSSHATLHNKNNRLDIPALLRAQPIGTHVYVCGPARLIETIKETMKVFGWNKANLHYEQFTHATGGAPFEVKLAKSGLTILVSDNQTLLEALENANLEPAYMCRGGVCGACETRVIEGQIEHRDHVMTVAEKISMEKMMICVSRAACQHIVIDL